MRHFKAGRTVTAWRGPYLGVGPIQGETWRPYIPIPSFPEYTSGHSTFSAAAAAVLKDFRGADAFNASARVAKGTSFVEPATDTQVVVAHQTVFHTRQHPSHVILPIIPPA